MECECGTKCSGTDSAYTTIKEEARKAVSDGQYNGNEEESRNQETVGQNPSMYYHQVHYVV